MKRQIITIDQSKCTGCGDCIPNCPEGAIQMIDGKARVVNLSLCDGLGACIGHCPEGAIATSMREAAEYDEIAVLTGIIPQGENTLRAHLRHLEEHGQTDLLEEAEAYLAQHGIEAGDRASLEEPVAAHACSHGHAHSRAQAHEQAQDHGGCPGSAHRAIGAGRAPHAEPTGQPEPRSALTHWPVQLHLISPAAPQFKKSDLLLAADCTAFSLGAFHGKLLAGRTLAIACPKLDDGQEAYAAKLAALIDQAEVNTITVATMEVPCCTGLLTLAQRAAEGARRKVPLKHVVVSVEGEIRAERWV